MLVGVKSKPSWVIPSARARVLLLQVFFKQKSLSPARSFPQSSSKPLGSTQWQEIRGQMLKGLAGRKNREIWEIWEKLVDNSTVINCFRLGRTWI